MMALSVIIDRENIIGENMILPETASSRWAARKGLSFLLGPTKLEEGGAYNFLLYLKHAKSVTFLQYTERDIVDPVFKYLFNYLKNKTDNIWHCRILLVLLWGAPTMRTGYLEVDHSLWQQ